MKQFIVIFILSMLSLSNFAANVTLSGYVKDKANGEALIGATIYVNALRTGVVANNYGFYSVSIPAGSYTVTYSCIGYQTQAQEVNLKISKQLNVMLAEETKQIEEVVVSGEKKNRNVESLQMSIEKMPVKMVKKLPAFMGEIDIIKSKLSNLICAALLKCYHAFSRLVNRAK